MLASVQIWTNTSFSWEQVHHPWSDRNIDVTHLGDVLIHSTLFCIQILSYVPSKYNYQAQAMEDLLDIRIPLQNSISPSASGGNEPMTFFAKKGFLAKQVQKPLCNIFPYLEFHNKY